MAGSPAGFSGGTPAALGAYFDGRSHNFAYGGAFTNQIVSRPTMFAFASGIGLMGEAGPEAIMPLKRDSSGRLGVYASGGGGGNDSGLSVVINDMRSNANSERVQTSEQRGPNGKRVLSVLIRDEMRRQIRSGDLDREMSGSYGNTRTLARL
jgi:phage-related minor tail protein